MFENILTFFGKAIQNIVFNRQIFYLLYIYIWIHFCMLSTRPYTAQPIYMKCSVYGFLDMYLRFSIIFVEILILLYFLS